MRPKHALLAPFLVSLALLADAPRPAADLVKEASTRASASGKNVLVLFHASWCGWCRRLEAALARPEVKDVVERHYETLWLTVQERAAKKGLENPGGAELFLGLSGGVQAGLPFTATVDPSGRALATSLRSGENLGYPGTREEISGFVAVLRAGAPRMTDAEAETLRRAFPVLSP